MAAAYTFLQTLSPSEPSSSPEDIFSVVTTSTGRTVTRNELVAYVQNFLPRLSDPVEAAAAAGQEGRRQNVVREEESRRMEKGDSLLFFSFSLPLVFSTFF